MIPRLTMSMMQLDYHPNPYYLARKIRDSYEFIDQNRNITLADLPRKWINFWRVKDAYFLQSPMFPPDGEMPTHYSVTVSHIIFSYIYSKYYREADFADMDNYWQTYVDFQRMLLLATSLSRSRRDKLYTIKLFDLKNLSDNLVSGEYEQLARMQDV